MQKKSDEQIENDYYQHIAEDALGEFAEENENDVCPACGCDIAKGEGTCVDCEMAQIVKNGMTKKKYDRKEYDLVPSGGMLQPAGYILLASGDYDNPVPKETIEQAWNDYANVVCFYAGGMDYDEGEEELWVRGKKEGTGI